jgi:hypothetical protein
MKLYVDWKDYKIRENDIMDCNGVRSYIIAMVEMLMDDEEFEHVAYSTEGDSLEVYFGDDMFDIKVRRIVI